MGPYVRVLVPGCERCVIREVMGQLALGGKQETETKRGRREICKETSLQLRPFKKAGKLLNRVGLSCYFYHRYGPEKIDEKVQLRNTKRDLDRYEETLKRDRI